MRCLVVGGTGFIGQQVVAALRERGWQPTVLVRPGSPQPRGVECVAGDAVAATVEQWRRYLDGQDAVVYATGVDDRQVPRAPAEAYFRGGNVEPVRRMMRAGAHLRSAVILGSYFTAIDRQLPELSLAAVHPYIRSRVEQAAVARAEAPAGCAVAVLEVPFVFGAVAGRRPLWAPMVPWLRSRLPLVAPQGGTAVVTVETAGAAAAAAVDRAYDGNLPVVQDNLRWDALFSRFAVAAGRDRPVVRRLPTSLLAVGLHAGHWWHRLSRREAGLDHRRLAALLTRDLFLDPAPLREFDLPPTDLDAALRATVAASG